MASTPISPTHSFAANHLCTNLRRIPPPHPPPNKTQVAFAFGVHDLPPALRLLPASGVVPPKSHALIALRYAPPPAPAALCVNVPLVFNRSASNTASLEVRGSAHEPAITTSLAPANKLFLRPTCVGTASRRSVEVVNPGRVAAGWRWAVSRKLRGVVSVEPEVGGGALARAEGAAPGLRRSRRARHGRARPIGALGKGLSPGSSASPCSHASPRHELRSRGHEQV